MQSEPKNQTEHPLVSVFKQALFNEFYGCYLFEKQTRDYYNFKSYETGNSAWLIPSQSEDHVYEARRFTDAMKRPSINQVIPKIQRFEHHVPFDELMFEDQVEDIKNKVKEGGSELAQTVNRCFIEVLMTSVLDSTIQTQGKELERFLARIADELTDRGFNADRFLFPKRLKNRLLLEVIEQDDEIDNTHYVGRTSTGLRAFWSAELPDDMALVFDSTTGIVIAQDPKFKIGRGDRPFHVAVGGLLKTNLILKDLRAIIPVALASSESIDSLPFVTQILCLLDRGNGTSDETLYFAGKSHDDLVEEFRRYLEMHFSLIGSSHVEITQALNDRGTDLQLKREGCKIGFQIKSPYDVSEDDFSAKVKRQLAESSAHGLDKWFLLICSPLQYEGHDYTGRITHLLNEISTYKTNYAEAYGPRNAIRYFNNPDTLSEEEFIACLRQRS
jgi:hypothetical protein